MSCAHSESPFTRQLPIRSAAEFRNEIHASSIWSSSFRKIYTVRGGADVGVLKLILALRLRLAPRGMLESGTDFVVRMFSSACGDRVRITTPRYLPRLLRIR